MSLAHDVLGHQLSSAGASRSSQPPSKLRSSCDACGQSKVKCDRGRPSCSRCLGQGIPCHYGISRKTGKPRRRHAIMPNLPMPSPPYSTASGQGENEHQISGPSTSTSCHDPFRNAGNDTMEIDFLMSAADPNLPNWFAMDRPALNSTPSPGSITSLWNDMDMNLSLPTGTHDTNLSTAAVTSAINQMEPSTARPSRLSCAQQSKEIMRHLYCANPYAAYSDGEMASSLDLGSVLTRNRAVVAWLRLLLKCSCARSPHTAMLYASIMSHVLVWYDQAAANAGPSRLYQSLPEDLSSHVLTGNEWAPSSCRSTSPQNSETHSLDLKQNAPVLPTPVVVGSFRSEDRVAQTAMTLYLLLTELAKFGDLIPVFMSLGVSESNTRGATADNCSVARQTTVTVTDTSLFERLGVWLRTEHRRVVSRVRQNLSELDENLRLS